MDCSTFFHVHALDCIVLSERRENEQIRYRLFVIGICSDDDEGIQVRVCEYRMTSQMNVGLLLLLKRRAMFECSDVATQNLDYRTKSVV
jgi:hypothetical protein